MKYNVLYIIPNLRKGGAERMVIDLTKELSARTEFNVALVILHNDIEYKVDDISSQIHHTPATIQISIWRSSLYSIAGLQKFVDEFKPNIIHSHLFEAEIISRSLSYPAAKWFTHCHDNIYQFKNFSLKTLISKKEIVSCYEKQFLFKRYRKNGGTNFIAISKDTKKYFKKNAPFYPTTLLYNPINYDRFYKPRLALIASSQPLKLINTGSFVDKKNQKFLIELARLLKDKKLQFELHLLGDGVNRQSLEQKAIEYGLVDYVFFHGNVHDVESYLWASDMYVHSATYEPFGLALIEAMAAGLPVISLDGRGNRDLIEEGKNGYMIFDEDIDEFVEKIIELANNTEKYNRISTYAQNYAKQYDIKIYTDKLIQLYKIR